MRGQEHNVRKEPEGYLPEPGGPPRTYPDLHEHVLEHGYDLGVRPPALERQADMTVRSEYFDFSDELIAGHRPDVNMNDPVEHKIQVNSGALLAMQEAR